MVVSMCRVGGGVMYKVTHHSTSTARAELPLTVPMMERLKHRGSHLACSSKAVSRDHQGGASSLQQL